MIDKRYYCNSCKYKWESKKKFGEPSHCPKCKKDNIVKYNLTKEHKKILIKEKKILIKEKKELRDFNKWVKALELKDKPRKRIWRIICWVSFFSTLLLIIFFKFLFAFLSLIVYIISYSKVNNRTNKLIYKHAKGKNLEIVLEKENYKNNHF